MQNELPGLKEILYPSSPSQTESLKRGQGGKYTWINSHSLRFLLCCLLTWWWWDGGHNTVQPLGDPLYAAAPPFANLGPVLYTTFNAVVAVCTDFFIWVSVEAHLECSPYLLPGQQRFFQGASWWQPIYGCLWYSAIMVNISQQPFSQHLQAFLSWTPWNSYIDTEPRLGTAGL